MNEQPNGRLCNVLWHIYNLRIKEIKTNRILAQSHHSDHHHYYYSVDIVFSFTCLLKMWNYNIFGKWVTA